MKIRTQFFITMLLFGIVMAVIAALAIGTNRQLERVGRQERIAAGIAQEAGELGYLSYDYLIYREIQQLKRWQSTFASFSEQVARLNVTDSPEQQALVRNIRRNQSRYKEVFDSVASAPKRTPRDRNPEQDQAFLQVSWSRIAVQEREIVSDASRLSQLLHQQMNQLTKTSSMFMYFMTSLFGVFLIAGYMITSRRILKSIATLQAGTGVGGSGNLDYVIEEGKKDEIGDLSRAFNQMTRDLKAVTSSKETLEREIAERRAVEEELRRQREWFRVTLTSIGDAVMTTDASGRVTFLNPVAQALTGWQAEAAVGQPSRNIFRIINERSGEPGEDIIGRVLQAGTVVTLANHTALVTREGRTIPIEDSAAPIKDDEGGISGVVLVFHDVTTKRRAQEALQESEKRYRNLFGAMNEGFGLHEIICDDDGKPRDYRFLEVNPAFESQTGLKAADLLGRTLREVLPESESIWVERYGSVALTGRPIRFDHWSKALGRHFEGSAFQTEKGRFGVLFLDVTERKRAEEALRQTNELLETRVQERTVELMKTVEVLEREVEQRRRAEHELNLSNEQLSAKAHQLRALAGELTMAEQRERRRLSQILHDGLQQYLAAAKMQVGGLAANNGGDTVLQIEQLLSEAIQISRSLSADLSPPILYDRGLAPALGWLARMMRDRHAFTVICTIRDEPDLPEDAKVLLFHSVRELLFNAVKHSGVSAAEVGMQAEDGHLQITVSDSGAGFEPQSIIQITESGGGFGLFSIRERLSLLHGSLKMESAPGRGSRFTLAIPHSGKPVEPERLQMNTHDVIRVLLVDDHALFRDGLARLCKREPDIVVVGHAETGTQAVDLADKLRPHVVLMDVNLPGLNGIEATRAICNSHPEVKIIGLSMYSDEHNVQSMRQAGAVDYKTKDCSAADLVAAIRAFRPVRENSISGAEALPKRAG